MLAGAMVTYLEAYPLNEYSMYGAVPLTEIKQQLLALRRAGKLLSSCCRARCGWSRVC